MQFMNENFYGLERMFPLERNIHNVPELKGLRPESTKPSSVSDF